MLTLSKSDHVYGSLTSYIGELLLSGGYFDGGNKDIESASFENNAVSWDIVGQMNAEAGIKGRAVSRTYSQVEMLNGPEIPV